MKVASIDQMTKGWFVGNFEPTLYKTNACEVAVKKYKAGASEEAHYHKIATEITVVTKGRVCMNGKIYEEGSVIVMEPGEVTDFVALTDAENVVVKIPGANDDKYVAVK